MRVFVTGATGFIGSAIVQELIGDGHQVLGLARSDAAAGLLAAAGAEVQRGALDDLESLRRGAAAAEGVIHTAFALDIANHAAAAETDWRAIETLGAALAGSGRPFVVTAVTLGLAPGRVATEDDPPTAGSPLGPRVSETAAQAFASQGVRVSVVRLPPLVHGDGDHGLVPTLITIARAKRVSAYVGDGLNRWPAVHRLDAAHLYRLALEQAPAGTNLHAVADEGVPIRDIAAVIGRRLDVPVVSTSREDAAAHFGWRADAFSLDAPASSARTRERFGWRPVQASLLSDIDRPPYFEATA